MTEIEFECPYCERKQMIEIEGMTEYDYFIEKCNSCGKEFNYNIQYSVDGFTSVKEKK